jgi:hypothetical protein
MEFERQRSELMKTLNGGMQLVLNAHEIYRLEHVAIMLRNALNTASEDISAMRREVDRGE